MAEYIVSSVSVVRGRGTKARRTFGIGTDVDDGTWYPVDGYTLQAWRVSVPTKAEAAPVVMHWLAEGRPQSMLVRQVFPRRTTVEERVAALHERVPPP